MSEDAKARAKALLDSLPEFDGTLEEALQRHEDDSYEAAVQKGMVDPALLRPPGDRMRNQFAVARFGTTGVLDDRVYPSEAVATEASKGFVVPTWVLRRVVSEWEAL